MSTPPGDRFARLRAHLASTGARLYLGTSPDGGGMALGDREQALLVLGPPRSGKTSTLLVPNVLAAPGPLLTTSTKPDVLEATAGARSELGRCWLFDPTGSVRAPQGVTTIRWSPVCAARRWDEALLVTHAMVGAARPGLAGGEADHWRERAEALLAPLLHAAALGEQGMADVSRWVLRHDLGRARRRLEAEGASVAAAVLEGIDATDGREQSGIWSTAAGVLAAYRSDATLASAEAPNFDPQELPGGADTVYVCAPGRAQRLASPIAVGFVEQVRAAAYRAHASGRLAQPVLLALDELANIAPLPDLPAMVSEGGGQGLLTIACLQDLSQARERWGRAADGFLSLFGAKVVLPGIGDLATLDLVSRLGGEEDVVVRSTSRSPWWSAGRGGSSETRSPRRQRRLPLDAVNQQPPGTALVICGPRPPERVRLPPWWAPALPAPGAPGLGRAGGLSR